MLVCLSIHCHDWLVSNVIFFLIMEILYFLFMLLYDDWIKQNWLNYKEKIINIKKQELYVSWRKLLRHTDRVTPLWFIIRPQNIFWWYTDWLATTYCTSKQSFLCFFEVCHWQKLSIILLDLRVQSSKSMLIFYFLIAWLWYW